MNMKGFRYFVPAALVCALLAQTEANVVGEIELDGLTLYVWRQFGSVTVEDGTMTVSGNSRLYLLENPNALIQPDDYYQVTASNSYWLNYLQ